METTAVRFKAGTKHGWEIPWLIAIVVLALGVRITVAVVTTSWVFPDRWQYGYEMGQIADSLTRGEGFSWPYVSPFNINTSLAHPTAWMPPVYPFIIAAAFKSLGAYSKEAAITLEFFQILISVLTCVMLYILGKRFYNVQAGLIAAFLFAMYPPAIHFAVQKIWSTSLFAFCVLLVIFIFLRLSDHPRVKSGIYLGILLAFIALLDPIIIGVYPFAFVWLYLKAEGNRRTVTKLIATAVVAFFLSLSPWLVRNYFVFGQFVFIKSNFGSALYLGNREGTTGSYKDSEKDFDFYLSAFEKEYLRQSDEIAGDRLLLQKAVAFIVEKPLSFAQRSMNRFVHYWTVIRPQPGLGGAITLTAYLTVFILAVGGLVLSGVKRHDIQLILLFPLLLPVPYYLTIIDLFRYRFPIEPILVIFAGYTIYRMFCRLRKILILTRQAPAL
jgi:4-amino-4-deoxy-L-arabinose transferase-like glycosyltransferase